MHGRTFKTNIVGSTATLWGPAGPYWGMCGVIVAKRGEATKGHGYVTLRFADGGEREALYSNVAMGDNSHTAQED